MAYDEEELKITGNRPDEYPYNLGTDLEDGPNDSVYDNGEPIWKRLRNYGVESRVYLLHRPTGNVKRY